MSVEGFLDENVKEMIESITVSEEKVEEVTIPVPVAVILPEIVPTEDPGPLYVEPAPAPPVKPLVTPVLNPPPKRHPRNVPKFSRLK